jgi:hypothetical protein
MQNMTVALQLLHMLHSRVHTKEPCKYALTPIYHKSDNATNMNSTCYVLYVICDEGHLWRQVLGS